MMFTMTLAWNETPPILRGSTDGGEGIILRPWSRGDTESIHRACQDPEIIRWTTVPHPYTQEHAASFADHSAMTWNERTGAPFAVVDETTDAVLASCGLVDVDPANSTVEVGYWVAPWARGRGVATAAARAVTRWAIEELGAQRVSLEAASANIGSQKVALNAGFTREGLQRSKTARSGERHDMVLFSLLPGEGRP
ncbi:MAG: GNAT family N-acetyltransferase [Arthrobacter sp.]|uniref:GNAT family N-acetyltransferase n=2 Tax=Arthrobacter TaxID=1663 RepID=UPI003FB9599A